MPSFSWLSILEDSSQKAFLTFPSGKPRLCWVMPVPLRREALAHAARPMCTGLFTSRSDTLALGPMPGLPFLSLPVDAHDHKTRRTEPVLALPEVLGPKAKFVKQCLLALGRTSGVACEKPWKFVITWWCILHVTLMGSELHSLHQ